MRDHAVQAVVARRCGDDDQLALGLRQPLVGIHECGVEREEGTELLGPAGECEEHVGNEAGLLLHGENLVADVVGQIVEGGHVEPRDHRVAHRVSIADVVSATPRRTQPPLPRPR